MNIIAIGDIHGRCGWKKIINKHLETADKIVFIGDYWDSFDLDYETQKANFNEIIQLKKDYPEKIVLLFGNHDFHYLVDFERSSGFQSFQCQDIREMVHNAVKNEYLQMCFISEKYLFSHAGITRTWLEMINKTQNRVIDADLGNPVALEKFLNELLLYTPSVFRFCKGENNDGYGDDKTQSPIWVRPKSLSQDMLRPYTHIVGHTQQDTIKIIGIDLFLIDVPNQYLQLNDGAETIKNLSEI